MEQKISLKITGISCHHCVKAITDLLSGFASVKNIQVDQLSGLAEFVYAEQIDPLANILTALEEEGYPGSPV